MWSAIVLASLLVMFSGGSASAFGRIENAGVCPENGPWSSTFTFWLRYVDDLGALPEYPVLNLDNFEHQMVENDILDSDSSDGKVYVFYWTPGKENVGEHSFYFSMFNNFGAEVRYPQDGLISGPLVTKAGARLTCWVSESRASPGDSVEIGGKVVDAIDNSPIGDVSISLYSVCLENEVLVANLTSGPEGNFSTTLEVSAQGILCYRVRLEEDPYYENTSSEMLYVSSLDGASLFWGYMGPFVAVVMILGFILTLGLPRLFSASVFAIGAVIGFLLMYVGAGELGILAAGAITGYLASRRIAEWGKHLRLGLITGLILVLLVGGVLAYFFTLPPEVLGFNYSVTQGEISSYMFQWSIYSAILFMVFSGIGAVIGGLLRKILKRGKTEISQVAGKSAAG